MSHSTVSRDRDALGVREIVSLWTHRRTLRSLALHNLRRSYAGTSGGVLWAVVTPLVPMLVFAAIFSFGLRLPLGGAPYIFGFATAYVPWVLVSAAVTGATASLLDHRYLVKRTRFPLEILPGEAVLVHSLSHACLVGLVTVVCAIAGYSRLAAFPLVIYFYLCAIVLVVALGLLVSSIAVVLPDVRQVLPSMLNVWFWLTPIAWAPGQLPPAGRALLPLNPIGYLVSGYRSALMPSVFPAPTAVDAAAFWTITIGLLLIGSFCFRRLRIYFWDCL